MFDDLLIIEFQTAEEAVEFALEINPNNKRYYGIMEIEAEYPGGGWLFVVGLCDICGAKDIYFAPVSLYEDGIEGCECSNCGNMSLYPKEGNFEMSKSFFYYQNLI